MPETPATETIENISMAKTTIDLDEPPLPELTELKQETLKAVKAEAASERYKKALEDKLNKLDSELNLKNEEIEALRKKRTSEQLALSNELVFAVKFKKTHVNSQMIIGNLTTPGNLEREEEEQYRQKLKKKILAIEKIIKGKEEEREGLSHREKVIREYQSRNSKLAKMEKMVKEYAANNQPKSFAEQQDNRTNLEKIKILEKNIESFLTS